MAKVYKATMYFVDLNEGFDIKEYERMINDSVLDRISTTGYCLLVENKSRELTENELDDWDNNPLNNIDNIQNPDNWESLLNG